MVKGQGREKEGVFTVGDSYAMDEGHVFIMASGLNQHTTSTEDAPVYVLSDVLLLLSDILWLDANITTSI